MILDLVTNRAHGHLRGIMETCLCGPCALYSLCSQFHGAHLLGGSDSHVRKFSLFWSVEIG